MIGLDDFVANLIKTGLVSSREIAEARAEIGPTPEPRSTIRLAQSLIDRGVLTSYQARKVLAGATRGFLLDGYRLLRPLGRGGMGQVFLATAPDGGRVAVKVLPPRKALEEENALQRFRRERDLSRRCSHPNLARTLDEGNVGDIHYMVMEHIKGKSLYDLVRNRDRGALTVPDASRIFLKVLDGLEAAHEAGLIHRDIKPSNIMITPEGEAKVLDLGLARALGEEVALTRANAVLGTLDYASPEQLSDAAKADRRSDLYSLGCTLYFVLAGRPPFEGGDMINKIFKQRMEDPAPLEDVARGVPAAFAAIVRKLMAKAPDDRYQTCQELRADLKRWTDPARVRAILGERADAARTFRPPPPELEDSDLRLLESDDDSIPLSLSLRDLGSAEADPSPHHRAPLPPATAVIRSAISQQTPAPGTDQPEDEFRWLIRFSIVIACIGLLAILFIALFLG
jgi:serine/threonine protein kinase